MVLMEDQLDINTDTSHSLEEFADAFDDCRQRVQRVVDSQRGRMRDVEGELDAQVKSLLQDLEQQRESLREESSLLKQRQDETASQRKRIARDLRAQRAELFADVEREHALRMQSAAGKENEQSSHLMAECAKLRDKLGEEEQRWKLAEQQISEWKAEAEQLKAHAASAAADVAEREREIVSLRQELATAQQHLEDARQQTGSDNSEEMEDLRRGRQMAIDDFRELKQRNEQLELQNAELEQQLSSRPAGGAASFEDGALDWASQKARMLAQLESDFDETDPKQVENRLTIEQAIRRTEKALQQKDEEIQELRRLLEDQSASIGGMAVGANAIAELLDHDELVRDERENLKRLQEEWREKLRVAEVDISVERAKLARERATLEDKLQAMESERKKLSVLKSSGAGEAEKKPTRNKWLSRLGLQNDD